MVLSAFLRPLCISRTWWSSCPLVPASLLSFQSRISSFQWASILLSFKNFFPALGGQGSSSSALWHHSTAYFHLVCCSVYGISLALFLPRPFFLSFVRMALQAASITLLTGVPFVLSLNCTVRWSKYKWIGGTSVSSSTLLVGVALKVPATA